MAKVVSPMVISETQINSRVNNPKSIKRSFQKIQIFFNIPYSRPNLYIRFDSMESVAIPVKPGFTMTLKDRCQKFYLFYENVDMGDYEHAYNTYYIFFDSPDQNLGKDNIELYDLMDLQDTFNGNIKDSYSGNIIPGANAAFPGIAPQCSGLTYKNGLLLIKNIHYNAFGNAGQGFKLNLALVHGVKSYEYFFAGTQNCSNKHDGVKIPILKYFEFITVMVTIHNPAYSAGNITSGEISFDAHWINHSALDKIYD